MDFVTRKLVLRELALYRVVFGSAPTARAHAASARVARGAFAGLVATRSPAPAVTLAPLATS